MSQQHQQICQPVAAQLRASMWLATFAQGLKIGIWLLMIHIVFTVSQSLTFPYWQIFALLVTSILYYTCKIKAHDKSHYAAFELEKMLRQQLAKKISQLSLGKVNEIGSGGLTKVLCQSRRSNTSCPFALYANADHAVFDRVRRVFTLACAAFHLWLFCLFSVSRRVN